MIFVDTGAWYSAYVAADERHQLAASWLEQNEEPLLTTDYVVVEFLTLCRARGFDRTGQQIGRWIWNEDLAEIEKVTSIDFEQAFSVFSTFNDKPWSFTDCTSRVIMQRLGITTAFAFDDDFRQFGTVDVVPQLAAESRRI